MACCKHEPNLFQPNLHQAFLIGIILNLGFVAVEITAGVMAHSLALVADALHNLGDALGLIVSWVGYYFSFRKPTENFTYGFGRVSLYATVLNGLLLCLSTIWIVHEAINRFQSPQETYALAVGGVALIGIVINGATAWLLMRGRDDINVKSAMVHMWADAGVSLGVVISAIVIGTTGWLWIDPALSAIIAVVIFASGWPLLVEGTRLSLDAIPKRIDVKGIREFLDTHPHLSGVFDLHIWALSTTKAGLSAHLTVRENVREEDVVHTIHRALKRKFGITHVTLQVEKHHNHCVDEHEEKDN